MAPEASTALSRRRLLALAASIAAALPVSLAISCSDSAPKATSALDRGAPTTAGASAPPPPEPTAAPPPFVVAAGEEQRSIMAGTKFETPLYVFGSGRAGPVALALGGVHGNEPGGWLAADRLVDKMRPDVGALLVIPHTNKIAMGLFARTTDEIGDINRAYPGNADGTPGEQIAAQIMQVIRDFHVSLVHDMHESWAFYKDRPQNGTAFLGQTVATNAPEPGPSMARASVDAVNTRIQSPLEEFFFRDRFGSNQAAAPGVPNGPSPAGASAPDAARPNGVSSSSLGIPNFAPGVVSILVEMGQQQALERRIALHVDMFTEFLRREGVLEA
jgi:hypothetical protein